MSQVGLKKTKVKLDLLTDDGGLCYSFNKYAKSKNKYMKDNDKTEEPSYFKYFHVNT